MRTPCILKYARSQSSLVANSMNAYCKLSPDVLSRMTSHERILPKREKISSRSSSRVTGLSLQTKRICSGGVMSAEGKSPMSSSVSACARASRSRRTFSSFSGSVFSSSTSSYAIRTVARCSSEGSGLEGGSTKSGGSS